MKTIKIPVSEEITKRKKYIINRISERMTYGVQLYIDIIVKNDITEFKEANKFQKYIGEKTGLPSAFVQCARDMGLWMYRSYKELHRDWERRIEKLEKKLRKEKNKKL